jgi:hypothetical protein
MSEDWRTRLATNLVAYLRKQGRRRERREVHRIARNAGLPQRHARKLARLAEQRKEAGE